MKVFALVFLSAIFACVSASVLPEMVYDGPVVREDGELLNLEDVDTDGGLSTSPEQWLTRYARFTCNVLSTDPKYGSIGSRACSLKCWLQGRKGGSCSERKCNCRS